MSHGECRSEQWLEMAELIGPPVSLALRRDKGFLAKPVKLSGLLLGGLKRDAPAKDTQRRGSVIW